MLHLSTLLVNPTKNIFSAKRCVYICKRITRQFATTPPWIKETNTATTPANQAATDGIFALMESWVKEVKSSQTTAPPKNSTPHTQNSTPSTQKSAPHTQKSTPHTQKSTPHIQNSTPHIQNSSPHAQHSINSPAQHRSRPANNVNYTQLLDQCGDNISLALDMLSRYNVQDVRPWGRLVNKCRRLKKSAEAFELFQRAVTNHVPRGGQLYTQIFAALTASTATMNEDHVMKVFEQAENDQIILDEVVYQTILPLMLRAHQTDSVLKKLRDISSIMTPTPKLFYLLIQTCGALKKKDLDSPDDFISSLLQIMSDAGVKHDLLTYTHVMTASDPEKFTDIMEKMKAKRLTPDFAFYRSILSILAKTEGTEKLEKILELMQNENFEFDDQVYEIMVRAHLKEGHIQKSTELFLQRLKSYPDIPHSHLTHLVIEEMLHHNELESVKELLKIITGMGVTPFKSTYVALLYAYKKAGKITDENDLAKQISQMDLDSLGGALTKAVTKVRNIQAKLINKTDMREKTREEYIYLISTSATSEDWKSVVKYFNEMLDHNIEYDLHTASVGISAIARQHPIKSFTVFEEIQGKFPSKVVLYFGLLSGLAESGNLNAFRKGVTMMKKDGVVPTKQTLDLISANLAQSSKLRDAIDEIHHSKTGVFDDKSFTPILTACGLQKDPENAKEVMKIMREKKIVFTVGTYDTLIMTFALCNDLVTVTELLNEFKKLHLPLNPAVSQVLIIGASALQNTSELWDIFNSMKINQITPTELSYYLLLIPMAKLAQHNRTKHIFTYMAPIISKISDPTLQEALKISGESKNKAFCALFTKELKSKQVNTPEKKRNVMKVKV